MCEMSILLGPNTWAWTSEKEKEWFSELNRWAYLIKHLKSNSFKQNTNINTAIQLTKYVNVMVVMI